MTTPSCRLARATTQHIPDMQSRALLVSDSYMGCGSRRRSARRDFSELQCPSRVGAARDQASQWVTTGYTVSEPAQAMVKEIANRTGITAEAARQRIMDALGGIP